MVEAILDIIFVIVFLSLSAFFSASEIALFSIPRERLLFFEKNSRKAFRTVYFLLHDGQRTLLLLLLGNTFINITLAGFINSLLNKLLPSNSPLFTLAIATLIIVTFGEVLPKNLALRNNEAIAIIIAPVLYLLKKLSLPLLKLIQKINRFFLIRFRQHLRRPNPFITIEELKTGVVEAAHRGAISAEEQDLIIGVLSSGALPVRKVMTHRSNLIVLMETASIGTAVAKLSEAHQTFALVRARGANAQILGTVTLHELLKADSNRNIKTIYVPAVWVPETMAAADLISFLFNEGRTEVCILDEFGSLSGAFSLSIGLNKILYTALPHVEVTGKSMLGNTMVFSGLQDVETIQDWLPPSLKSLVKESRTLNGVLTRYLGKIPQTGDKFAINGWNFYIMLSNPTRIESVLIRKGKENER